MLLLLLGVAAIVAHWYFFFASGTVISNRRWLTRSYRLSGLGRITALGIGSAMIDARPSHGPEPTWGRRGSGIGRARVCSALRDRIDVMDHVAAVRLGISRWAGGTIDDMKATTVGGATDWKSRRWW
jgi:hypothetical protein